MYPLLLFFTLLAGGKIVHDIVEIAQPAPTVTIHMPPLPKLPTTADTYKSTDVCLAGMPNNCYTKEEYHTRPHRHRRSSERGCSGTDLAWRIRDRSLYLLGAFAYMVLWRDRDRNYRGDGYSVVSRLDNTAERVEYMQSTIYASSLRQRNNQHISSSVWNRARRLLGAQEGDEAGHILAYTLGGPNILVNFFPQHRSLNRNYRTLWLLDSWVDMEYEVRRFLTTAHPHGRVELRVLLEYPNRETGRPDHITFVAVFYDRNGREVNTIQGRPRNQGRPDDHSGSGFCDQRFFKRMEGPQAMLAAGSPKLESHKEEAIVEDTEMKTFGRSECSRRVIGYFTSWGNQPLTDEQASKLTHLIYAFFHLDGHGHISLHGDHQRFRSTMDVAKSHGVKVLFALGGWDNSEHFSHLITNHRHRLIDNIVRTVKEHHFDGVDIDWEYPVEGGAVQGVKADKHNYITFLRELRERFNRESSKHWILSIASAAGESTVRAGYDLPELKKHIDFFNVMTYDYYGAWKSEWGGYTGPVAPLYRATPRKMSGTLNVDWTIKHYACRTKSLGQLNMGIPFYGRFWKNVGGTVAGSSDPIWRTADPTSDWFDGGSVNWADMGKAGWTDRVEFHDKTKTPYIYRADRREFLAFDNLQSIKAKMDYALSNDLGGVMIWAIDQDDSQLSLLNSISGHRFCGSQQRTGGSGGYKCPPIDDVRWWTYAENKTLAGMCGRSAKLYNGYYPVCNPEDSSYACCGAGGFCGEGPEYCDCPTCVDYGKHPEKILDQPQKPSGPVRWHTSDAADGTRGRCGYEAPKLSNGQFAICNPDDRNAHCCSNGGYCGSDDAHCKCDGCVDMKKEKKDFQFPKITWWTKGDNIGKCGPTAPRLPSGDHATCNPNHPTGHCCSATGWCGTGNEFCKCKGCVDYKH